MTTNTIKIGARVAFDSEDGPQQGTVSGFKADLGNGRSHALVKVTGTLNGEPWTIPVDQLQQRPTARV